MDEDLWHVRMAPDDVKQLTLEQLDDLFRLEVIEADTLIWQPGMTEWLPLSVVAGLGDEDPDPVNIAVSLPPPAPPPRMAQTATAWPPIAAPVSQRPLPAPSAPPPMRSVTPAPRSMAPAPVSVRPSGYSNPPRPAPVPATWSNPPPRPAPVSPFASTVAEPQYRSAPPPRLAPPVDPFAQPSPLAAVPHSTAPMARTQRMYRQRSGGGGWLVFLAFAAGVAVTLYRNDLVHAAALSVGQEGAYMKLETALGGPGFGTPRAVAQMAAAAGTVVAAADAMPAPSPSVPPPSVTSEATTASTSTTTAPAATATAAATATEAKPEAKQASTASAPAVASKPVSVTHAPAHAASRPASTADDVDPVFKTPKKGKKAGRGSEYDPLNPAL